jgi:hypothetical protein
MITSHFQEQIQYAGQADDMLTYIDDNFEWTDAQARCVNYLAIGTAKKRLSDARSIRTSKFMHGWLNIGTQKEKFGNDPTCPCCGRHDEDSLHLFRCEHTSMQQAFTNQINIMKESLMKDRLPRAVINGFISMICNAAHRDPPFYIGNESPFVQNAIECQESLGVEAILRGFHHVQWQETISKLWVTPQALGNGKAPKCKPPPELAVSLVSQAWDLFEIMWTTRNDILHSPESALFEKIDSDCTDRFLEFKRNKNNWIRSTDRFMIDVPLQDFLSWPRDRRRSLLLTWERLKNIYSSENTAQLRTQRRIDTFFDIRVPPDRDDSDDSYSSSDMSDSSDDSTSFASDLSGDTVLSFGVLLSSDMSSVDHDMYDEEFTSFEASRIGWNTD